MQQCYNASEYHCYVDQALYKDRGDWDILQALIRSRAAGPDMGSPLSNGPFQGPVYKSAILLGEDLLWTGFRA